jgi:single-stranded-DNA-specific exonuclease
MNLSAQRPWRLKIPAGSPVEALRASLGVSPFLAQLLVNRGLSSPEEAARFLTPKLAHLTPPDRMLDMDRAVARILKARATKERVRIFGDYDVDGQTSTSILLLFFRSIGLNASWELPHRHRDGYGLNPQAVDRAAQDGVTLLVTCDCGISNAKEITYALDRGIETVVIDHHRAPPELPPAAAVLNPHQPKCTFPFKGMCAAGVGFYLCAGVRAELRARGEEAMDIRELLDLVAMGTVADVVPLLAENRIFVRFGLEKLGRSARVGVRALKAVAQVGEGPMTATEIGFRLAPRLNAGGRLDDAGRGVRLLTTQDPGEAALLAAELDRENTARREIEKKILEEAIEIVEAGGPNRRSIVLASQNWHHGVIGIVASRLVDRYHLPAVLVALEGDRGRGSARGVPGMHLFDTFSKMAPTFQKFGGHAVAAGFSISAEKIPELVRGFEALARETFPDEPPPRELKIEGEVPLSSLSEGFYDELLRLAPFGNENPEPLLSARRVLVRSSRVVGKNHLKLQLDAGGASRAAIGFGMGEHHPVEGLVDLAFYAQKNTFRDQTEIELRLCDLRPSS